jgi:geranylgeranyl diphosphate synthase, type III
MFSVRIDDIEDNSKFRKGKPVAHSVYSLGNSINSANYRMFQGLENLLQLNTPGAIQVYTEQIIELHRGQGMDIYWRDNCVCPSESDYMITAIRKTGGLFKLGASLLQLLSGNKQDFGPLSSLLGEWWELVATSDHDRCFVSSGLYFQMFDDYCHMKKDPQDKNFADDITEGNFSFPIVIALNSETDCNAQLWRKILLN